MVFCAQKKDVNSLNTSQSDSQDSQKMASHVESCIGHMTEMYNGLKVYQEPTVRCQASPTCGWVGNYEEILYHCQQCHPQLIWLTGEQKREYTVQSILSKDSHHVELVVAYGHLFWLHVKNDLNTNRLYAACQQIATKNDDSHTKFMIRSELCDASKLNCISCSTETRPHMEDISKIFSSTHCAVRSHQRLQTFITPEESITFSVNITKMYYYQ